MKNYKLIIKKKIKSFFGYKGGYSQNNKQTYFDIPELSIKGRRDGTDIDTRMQGLDTFLNNIKVDDSTSLLDIGCAEGLVSMEFYNKGVATIHGFDLQDVSIEIATKLFKEKQGDLQFLQADLLDWESFENKHKNILLPKYSIVLFLSIYGHMARVNERLTNETLVSLVNKTEKYFIVRSTAPIPEKLILKQGFKVLYTNPAPDANKITVFEKI